VTGALRVGVVGHTGRLGSAVERAALAAGHEVVARVTRTRREVDAAPTVVIDAGHPAGLDRTLDLCRPTAAALVYCVSAYDERHEELLRDYARVAPVTLATNLARGHWLQVELVRLAAELVGAAPDVAVAVHDRHPRTKADRPSRTARELARTWHAASGIACTDVSSRRTGGPVSTHTVEIDLAGEQVTVSHDVTDLDAAARSAVTVAAWLVQQHPGLHHHHDALRPTRSAP